MHRLAVMCVCLASVAAAGVGDLREETFRVKTTNVPQAEIAGVLWKAERKPRGTVFMCHGFRRSMWDFRGYTWIADKEHWNVIRFDFRQHGQSSHESLQFPTLGYYETYDLKAVIDWAEAQKLPKPYVCIGHSLGASSALREASEDPRIAGVLAQSPFKSASDAVHKFRPEDARVQAASDVLLRGPFRQVLDEVDIVKAVAKRDDLLMWLTAGELDYFPESDQREILAASPAPPEMKRLEIIPGARHHEHWKWAGNDKLISAFLARSLEKPTTRPAGRAVSNSSGSGEKDRRGAQ